MNLDIMRLSEISQAEKEKYHMRSLTCGILKKWQKWIYLQHRNRLTNIESKLIVSKEESGGEG